jgi:uncharacterized iron-regulated protein
MIRSSAVLLLLALAVPVTVVAQHPQRSSSVTEGVDFQVYGPNGEPRSFAELLTALDEAEVALVGEYHTDSIGHEVEEEILIRAAQRFGIVGGEAVVSRPVVLSLEFFERDVQVVLDEYLADLVTEDQFLKASRPWDNYDPAYRPMVEFARAHGVPVVAANAPRRYVNRVTRLGPDALDALSDEAKRFLPPLPYPGPSDEYRAQFMAEMMEGMAEAEAEAAEEEEAEAEAAEEEAVEEEAEETREAEEEEATEDAPRDREGRTAPPDHGMGFALQSQALWDASMSHAIADALDGTPGALVIHYVGGFHVAYHTGIPEKVPHYRPGTRILTISMEPVEDIGAWDEEDHAGLADFVILTLERPDEEEGSSP